MQYPNVCSLLRSDPHRQPPSLLLLIKHHSRTTYYPEGPISPVCPKALQLSTLHSLNAFSNRIRSTTAHFTAVSPLHCAQIHPCVECHLALLSAVNSQPPTTSGHRMPLVDLMQYSTAAKDESGTSPVVLLISKSVVELPGRLHTSGYKVAAYFTWSI